VNTILSNHCARWLALAAVTVVLSACGSDNTKPTASQSAANATAAVASQAAPTITTQPLSTAVSAGATATFTIAATGEALSYQWQRNGEPVPNATGASYTTPAASTTDSGVKYSVQVSNSEGKVVSQSATLSVADAAFSSSN
jgi:hypothetical protein